MAGSNTNLCFEDCAQKPNQIPIAGRTSKPGQSAQISRAFSTSEMSLDLLQTDRRSGNSVFWSADQGVATKTAGSPRKQSFPAFSLRNPSWAVPREPSLLLTPQRSLWTVCSKHTQPVVLDLERFLFFFRERERLSLRFLTFFLPIREIWDKDVYIGRNPFIWETN